MPSSWGKFSFSSKRVKKYCEDIEIDYKEISDLYEGFYDTDLVKITCAGMPTSCYKHVTWDNFHIHSSFEGKLVPKHVKGGIILADTIFTIKAT